MCDATHINRLSVFFWGGGAGGGGCSPSFLFRQLCVYLYVAYFQLPIQLPTFFWFCLSPHARVNRIG